jgi:hypothetical protein
VGAIFTSRHFGKSPFDTQRVGTARQAVRRGLGETALPGIAHLSFFHFLPIAAQYQEWSYHRHAFNKEPGSGHEEKKYQ